jgi:hypothetical protein
MNKATVDTGSLEPLQIGEFAEFYHAARGYKPFAWQERLAEQTSNSVQMLG